MNRLIIGLTGLLLASSAQAGIFKKKVTIGPEDRPAELKLPRFYQDDVKVPMVMLLHGRGNNAGLTDLLFGLSRSQDQLGYALLLPNGTDRASDGQKVWDATSECCADQPGETDDSGYLQNLVKEAIAKYAIDPAQVFVLGHSNGGFMSYRLACDTNGMFKGMVSIAGSTVVSEDLCKTNTPINVLQIHGSEDGTVPFLAEGKKYPSAPQVVERWANRNNCQSTETKENALNLLFLTAEPALDENGSPTLKGNLFDFSYKPETDETLYNSCDQDVRVGLWKVNGADHVPVFIGRNVIAKALEFVGFEK